MSFKCTNIECSAPENKKGREYPSAMECPFCDVPLVEFSSFNEADLQLINTLPFVIAYPLKRTLEEKHPWTRINLFKDTFLNYLKYLGLLSASEFFNSPFKDKRMVALFHNTLAEPSFGTWNLFIRETLAFLHERNHSFFISELPAYYETIETGKKRKLFKGEIEFIDSNGDVQIKKQEATAIGMLINFRNRYLGHGLTLDASTSEKLWEEYYPIFKDLLLQMSFCKDYPMYKTEHGESFRLQSDELHLVEKQNSAPGNVWLENSDQQALDIIPFFVVPGEVAIAKEDKEQILAYESYTGKTIKFFSPEGTEKQTSGKILERLNMLLRDKQKEQPYSPEAFTKEIFLTRVAEENKLILDTLIAEKKVIPGVYVHREDMEIKLREWTGARANIFVMAAEAGSGKTNLLVEILKQYTEREMPTLFIRAGRMEKPSFHAQLCYLLNIDEHESLAHYPTIAGTQDAPTFVLIDGLNEAHDAEKLWTELFEISKHFEPGSLKFVVTSRANTSADINRYGITEEQEIFLYGDNKERENQVSAYTHWLTALSMQEMKQAWEYYAQKDKSKFKPLFAFDDLATFDRALYNQISNPLVLRLFLETYQGKNLPKKGNQHLDIWSDWLTSFSQEEQAFFTALANAIWEKGENEMLLDDVLKDNALLPYFTNDQLNSPYPRLRKLGWISRYVKDLNACIGFTVEGALLHLLGTAMHKHTTYKNIEGISKLIKNGSKIQKSAVEVYLSQLALNGDIKLISDLIDAGFEYQTACNYPMVFFLRKYGVEMFVDKVFSKPTDGDWRAVLMLNKTLDDLQEQFLRKQLLSNVSNILKLTSKDQILLAFNAIDILDIDDSTTLYKRVKAKTDIFYDSEILYNLAMTEKKFNNLEDCIKILIKSIHESSFLELSPNKAFNHYYETCKAYCEIGQIDKSYEYLNIILDSSKYNWASFELASAYNLKGYIETSKDGFYKNKKTLDKILLYYNMALDIRLKTLGSNHPDAALSYNNIAYIYLTKGDNDTALKYFIESLNIYLRVLDPHHFNLATIYNNLGVTYNRLKMVDLAIDYSKKVVEIHERRFGKGHRESTIAYNNLAHVLFHSKKYSLALENYKSCLSIECKFRGDDHPIVATMYFNIGNCYKEMKQFNNALKIFEQGMNFLNSNKEALRYMNGRSFREFSDFRGSYYYSIAESNVGIGKTEIAFYYFVKSAEIRKVDPEVGPEASSTKESIAAAKRLAKEMGKENELPKWIKENQ